MELASIAIWIGTRARDVLIGRLVLEDGCTDGWINGWIGYEGRWISCRHRGDA